MKRDFLVILMVIIALMACKMDSDSDPECNCPVKEHLAFGENCKCGLANCSCTLKPTCECPNGTLHLIGETCCERNNCTCEKKVPGQRVNGIAVTNRESVNNFGTMVTEFEIAFSYFTDSKLAFIEANLKEFRVIKGPDTPPHINGNIPTIGNERDQNDIWGILIYWLWYNGIDTGYPDVEHWY